MTALKALADYTIQNEKRIKEKLALNQYDVAFKSMLYTENIAEDRHATKIKTEIDDIFGSKTYDNNMWRKLMICDQGELRRKTLQQWYSKKEIFKKLTRPRTADYALEQIRKMTSNWEEAEEKMNGCFVKLGEIEREVREKNLEAWRLFLLDIATGEADALVDG